MHTRKQRRREQKSKRHEYEFVYVDAEGKELEEVPEELLEAERPSARNGSKATPAKKQQPQQRGGRRPTRTPQPPSWRRSVRRAGILGAIVFVLFALGARGKSGGYVSAAALALLYTALFVPFTYGIDRFAYRRWQARQQGGGTPAKKR